MEIKVRVIYEVSPKIFPVNQLSVYKDNCRYGEFPFLEMLCFAKKLGLPL